MGALKFLGGDVRPIHIELTLLSLFFIRGKVCEKQTMVKIDFVWCCGYF